MKTLCLYDALYKNYQEQIEYAGQYAKEFCSGPVVVEGYNDTSVDDMISMVYRLEKNEPEPGTLSTRLFLQIPMRKCWRYLSAQCPPKRWTRLKICG